MWKEIGHERKESVFGLSGLRILIFLILSAYSGMLFGGSGEHSLYIKSDGSLWGMGNNNYGQLGDGSFDNRSTPVEIESSGVLSVSSGTYHSLCIKSDGSLWGMGQNN